MSGLSTTGGSQAAWSHSDAHPDIKEPLARFRRKRVLRAPGRTPTCGQALRRRVVGPTMRATTAAGRPCYRIVTGGRGSWPSAWSGSACELTAWITRSPARPGATVIPPSRARRTVLGIVPGPRPEHGDEPLRGRNPPGCDGGRSVHPDRQRPLQGLKALVQGEGHLRVRQHPPQWLASHPRPPGRRRPGRAGGGPRRPEGTAALRLPRPRTPAPPERNARRGRLLDHRSPRHSRRRRPGSHVRPRDRRRMRDRMGGRGSGAG